MSEVFGQIKEEAQYYDLQEMPFDPTDERHQAIIGLYDGDKELKGYLMVSAFNLGVGEEGPFTELDIVQDVSNVDEAPDKPYNFKPLEAICRFDAFLEYNEVAEIELELEEL